MIFEGLKGCQPFNSRDQVVVSPLLSHSLCFCLRHLGDRGFTDGEGKTYTALEVAAEYFRSGADKVRRC